MIQFLADDFISLLHFIGPYFVDAALKGTQEMPEVDKAELSEYINRLNKHCHQIGLVKVKGRIGPFAKLLSHKSPILYAVVETEILALQECICAELGERKCLLFDPKKEELFEKDDLFGGGVGFCFPSATPEIRAAGNCLAFGLHTAAVFHSVRAVECGLRAFAKHLNVKTKFPIQYAEWGLIIDRIQKKIDKSKLKARGKKKSDEFEFYSVALSDCNALRECRNRVSHAREQFTESESIAAFDRAKSLMQNLSKRIVED